MTEHNDSGETEECEKVWPDDLEVGDTFEFDGNDYKVVGVGPGEATAERVGDSGIMIELGRWAFTDNVYVELEQTLTQEEFGRCLHQDGTDHDPGPPKRKQRQEGGR